MQDQYTNAEMEFQADCMIAAVDDFADCLDESQRRKDSGDQSPEANAIYMMMCRAGVVNEVAMGVVAVVAMKEGQLAAKSWVEGLFHGVRFEQVRRERGSQDGQRDRLPQPSAEGQLEALGQENSAAGGRDDRFCLNIDWDLLREQRAWLVKQDASAALGLLELIEALLYQEP